MQKCSSSLFLTSMRPENSSNPPADWNQLVRCQTNAKLTKNTLLLDYFFRIFFIFIIWLWVCVFARIIDFARDTIYWDINGVLLLILYAIASDFFLFLRFLSFEIQSTINVFRFFFISISLHVWCTLVFLMGSSDFTRSRPDLFWKFKKFRA